MENCRMCGKPSECTHHLVFGRGLRPLADKDFLYIPLCNNCHTMSGSVTERIHDNPAAEKLSKMLGQMKYERDFIAEYTGYELLKKARKSFLERYGRSYL